MRNRGSSPRSAPSSGFPVAPAVSAPGDFSSFPPALRDRVQRNTQERARPVGLRFSSCALILLAACSASFAQAPPADENSASVAGVVVNAITGDPMPGAHVILNGFAAGKQLNFGAMTTVEGKFSITGLSAGNYGAAANRLGFI